jgi:hypothetical protein
LIVPRGTVVFKVTNVGKLPHDFKFAGEEDATAGALSFAPRARV